jgi:hypothetical protein
MGQPAAAVHACAVALGLVCGRSAGAAAAACRLADRCWYLPAGPSKGLFTSTNPELRRVIPEVNGRVKVKVVYTVLEAQYQSALTAAVQAINSTNKTVCFELVGYLLEELRDVNNFETFKKDLQDANVFIGSLIFIEELAEKVTALGVMQQEKGLCCMLRCAAVLGLQQLSWHAIGHVMWLPCFDWPRPAV